MPEAEAQPVTGSMACDQRVQATEAVDGSAVDRQQPVAVVEDPMDRRRSDDAADDDARQPDAHVVAEAPEGQAGRDPLRLHHLGHVDLLRLLLGHASEHVPGRE